MLAVVIPGVVQGGQCSRGDGRPRAAAIGGAIRDAAVRILAGVDVLFRTLDDFGRHGMPALRQPRRPCTCVIVVDPSSKLLPSLRAHVAPAAGLRLGLAAELDRLRQRADQFLPAFRVFFLAQHLRQEQHRKAVAVGVAIVGRRIADQAIGASSWTSGSPRPAECGGVGALRGGRTGADQHRAGQRGHGRGISIAAPVAERRLAARNPLQPLRNRLLPPWVAFRGPRGRSGSRKANRQPAYRTS